MTDFLPDEIVVNILARLPAKPLLQFRRVSAYWNRMLSEPYFMKLRSRKTIILPLHRSIHLIDDDTHSILDCCPQMSDSHGVNHKNFVIGTFNGIVLLKHCGTMILYNPFTRVSKKLPCPRDDVDHAKGYGFGYGATPDDLKIVRLTMGICQVYCLKKNSWSSWNTSAHNIKDTRFEYEVGTFLNGCLHWIRRSKDVLTVVNVKNMIFSEIHMSFKREQRAVLGTIDGCLCLLNQMCDNGLEMWVLKDHYNDSWAKKCTFQLPLNVSNDPAQYRTLCIKDSGRILLHDYISNQPILYDTTKNSYKMLNISLRYKSYYCRGMEYVESLISPGYVFPE